MFLFATDGHPNGAVPEGLRGEAEEDSDLPGPGEGVGREGAPGRGPGSQVLREAQLCLINKGKELLAALVFPTSSVLSQALAGVGGPKRL